MIDSAGWCSSSRRSSAVNSRPRWRCSTSAMSWSAFSRTLTCCVPASNRGWRKCCWVLASLAKANHPSPESLVTVLSPMPALHSKTPRLVDANPLHSPSYGCGQRLDPGRLDAPLGHGGKTLRRKSRSRRGTLRPPWRCSTPTAGRVRVVERSSQVSGRVLSAPPHFVRVLKGLHLATGSHAPDCAGSDRPSAPRGRRRRRRSRPR
jgi:hypothetical protein